MSEPSPTFGTEIDCDIDRLVVSRRQIDTRVTELGREIARCYRGQELTLMVVLTGALIFVADLIRQMPIRMRLDMVGVSSYPAKATASQGPQFVLPVSSNLQGRHLLIVDDIFDSGQTLGALLRTVRAHEPASVRTCVLLRKDRPDLRDRTCQPDFVGFDVPDEFVVGYGLDHGHLYRNLPDICTLKCLKGAP